MNNQKPLAKSRKAPTAVGSGDLLGIVFQCVLKMLDDVRQICSVNVDYINRLWIFFVHTKLGSCNPNLSCLFVNPNTHRISTWNVSSKHTQ